MSFRRAAKRDRNHGDIRDGLRACGYEVEDLGDVGRGVPDLLVMHRGTGRCRLLEVKDPQQPPSARKLTADETDFHRRFRPLCVVVETLAQAVQAMRP